MKGEGQIGGGWYLDGGVLARAHTQAEDGVEGDFSDGAAVTGERESLRGAGDPLGRVSFVSRRSARVKLLLGLRQLPFQVHHLITVITITIILTTKYHRLYIYAKNINRSRLNYCLKHGNLQGCYHLKKTTPKHQQQRTITLQGYLL